jgi:hypothetical protein
MGEVDHHLSAGDGFFEPFSSDGVDATFARRRDNLVAALAQNGNCLRANQASAADHDYPFTLIRRSLDADHCFNRSPFVDLPSPLQFTLKQTISRPASLATHAAGEGPRSNHACT